MTEKYQNKYRIASARLPHWDYGWNTVYFVTICTQEREHYFGDIIDGRMQLSEIGDAEWLKTFEMRPDMNLMMGAYVIMPNHFHGIIVIGENKYNVETQCIASVQENSIAPAQKNRFGAQSKNLASIIREFKIGVTKNARKIHADFAW